MKTPTLQQRIDACLAQMARARTPFAAVAAASDLGFALAAPAERVDVCAHCGSDDLASFADDEDNVRCRACGAIDEPVFSSPERKPQ